MTTQAILNVKREVFRKMTGLEPPAEIRRDEVSRDWAYWNNMHGKAVEATYHAMMELLDGR